MSYYNSQIIEDFRKLGSLRSFQRTKKRMMGMINDSNLPGSPGRIPKPVFICAHGHYRFVPLNDEVVCVHVEQHRPTGERYATFEFIKKIAAFHHVPFTIPEKLWDWYFEQINFAV